MAEVAPAPATPAKAPKKKTSKAAKKKPGPSLSELIVKAVAASNERHGVSLAALKKSLVAAGYDLDKNKSRVKTAVVGLVTKGTLVQTKGVGASGSFKMNKKAEGKAKAPAKAAKKTPAKAKKPAAKKATPSKKPKSAAAKKTASKKPAKKAAKSTTPKKAAKKATKSPKKAAAPKKAPAAKKASAAKKSPAKRVAKPKTVKKAAPKKKKHAHLNQSELIISAD
ncbi:histone H1-like [Corythoichthys intestinalis]|uniref:histone H1-like n=1 Tax=Corythoichthys intestinalis TaxID=161448 RepID=UPI0025A51DDB|nr:histone H1-like [Corythoichthys intestinalis]